MQSYFTTEYKTICYDANNHILIATWKRQPESIEYREGMKAMLDAMEHFGTGKLVYDLRYHKLPIDKKDVEWTITEWLAPAIKAGHTHVVFIVSTNNVYVQVPAEDMMDKTENAIAYAYADNMEAAIRWLKTGWDIISN